MLYECELNQGSLERAEGLAKPGPNLSKAQGQLSNFAVLNLFSSSFCVSSVSLVNKAVVDYFFVDLGVERHFEALRHFLLMEDGEFAQSLSDLLFEKVGSVRFYITFSPIRDPLSDGSMILELFCLMPFQK